MNVTLTVTYVYVSFVDRYPLVYAIAISTREVDWLQLVDVTYIYYEANDKH